MSTDGTGANRGGRAADPVAALRRWEESGAVWRVEQRACGTVTIALMTCDGGEQVGQVRCTEDAVEDFLAGRLTNADA